MTDQFMLSPAGFSSSTKRLSVLFTPCCAAMMQTLATRTLRSEPTSLSSTCRSSPSSWRHCISSTTSVVSRTLRAANIVFLHLLQGHSPESPLLISLQTLPPVSALLLPSPMRLTQTVAVLLVSLLPWQLPALLCRMPKQTHLRSPLW